MTHDRRLARRTWPYGTRLDGRVADARTVGGHSLVIVAARPDGAPHDEAFAMIGGGHDVDVRSLRVGDHATIEFKEGGPLGGYWRVVSARIDVPQS